MCKICENVKCKKEHDGSYGSGRFCSQSCANSKHADIARCELKNAPCIVCGAPAKINKRSSVKTARCTKCKETYLKEYNNIRNKRTQDKRKCIMCGENICKRPAICKKQLVFPKLIKYFGFNSGVLGTIDVYKEFDRVKDLLEHEYHELQLSSSEIIEKYKYKKSSGSLASILNTVGIKLRNVSEGVSNAVLKGRNTVKNINNKSSRYAYKYGWHTTWENKKVYYRSSYELEFAKELDELQITYEMESIRLLYWDSTELQKRIAIPDFYLPDYHVLIEIKCSWTFDTVNMYDKFKVYKELGYIPYLVYDKEIITDFKSFIDNYVK